VYARLRVACKNAEVPYFAPGGARRFVVRELYRSGEDPSVAGAVVGHSPVVAMRHYRDVSQEEKREAMARARLGYGLLPDLDGQVIDFPERKRS
jgi:hypothetical protein